MSTIEQSIDVDVPVRAAYDQWTQFEEFPRFMEGVERIDQVTPTRTHWRTTIGGVTREFDAEITEQRPDERIAWTSLDRPRQAGVVTFHRIAPAQTRVMLQMEFAPEGIAEKTADTLNLVERRIKGDLAHFKEFIEARGAETGAWRGEVGQDPTA
ncbi:SRPBCC family protein [Thermomonospora umbrina]|uniref:Polyketide cyclase/dehydrase/lipid transport protein n=1 Tax=Thermomonospora umbrina TaxID=111806 RepID=A0A3D9T6M5_9ACTN|nr:SRPBCC family protein [Thermomonospora umbrina]REF00886.1 polyketide cyclase/dehydrase/lipid transport protein [Thermomonospora umbrina]